MSRFYARDGRGIDPLSVRRALALEEGADMLVQEFRILPGGTRTGGVSPQRGYRYERAVWNECGLVPRIAQRKVKVGLRGHVQDLCLDRTQGRLDVARERRRIAHIVALPRAHLQDQVVRIRARDEFRAEVLEHLWEGAAERGIRAPQLPAPPFLREQPPGPDHCKGLQSLFGRSAVVAALEGRIGGQGRNLPLQTHDSMTVGLCRARGRNDTVHVIRITHCPLESLLR